MQMRLTFLVVVLIGTNVHGSENPDPGEVVTNVVRAAKAILESLDDKQRDALLYDFDDQEQRRNWSNLPVRMVPRGGLRMGDLTDEQRSAVLALMEATLSPEGYRQILDNVEGDEVLAIRGNRQSEFGRDEFYVSILGQPSAEKPWMWQFGGHHLAINATVVGDRITLAPSLTGGQPMDYDADGRAVRMLAGEEDAALRLVASLTPEQRESAVLGDRYTNLNYGPGNDGAQPKQEGIPASELNEKQRGTLLRLIGERVGILHTAHAVRAMEQIDRDLDATWFAWYGPTDPDGAWTYRVQGPTVLMEYAPQRLGGDPADHVHAMYRDPTNDYGFDWIDP